MAETKCAKGVEEAARSTEEGIKCLCIGQFIAFPPIING
jgi:hypothetical protein